MYTLEDCDGPMVMVTIKKQGVQNPPCFLLQLFRNKAPKKTLMKNVQGTKVLLC